MRKRVQYLTYAHGRRADQEFTEFVRGKNVIIVGPAGYLQGQEKGKWIDSFDMVVRVNHAIPVLFPEDYGKRTSILYHIMSHRGEKGKTLVNRGEILTWKDAGLEWLVVRQSATSERVRQCAHLINTIVPWSCIHHRFSDSVKKSIRTKAPNTGIMAIVHLLNAQVASLTVTGFDLYASGVYENYGDLKDNEDALEVNSRWHNIDAQKEYMQKIVRRETRLHIDDHLRGALKP
jgi:hypothetical protein